MVDNVKYVDNLFANGKYTSDKVMIKTKANECVKTLRTSTAFTTTSIFDINSDKVYGMHYYTIDKKKSALNGEFLHTEIIHRNRSYGELLRLISIIHMKENELNKNYIDSLSHAIPFHFKYGFRTDFSNHKDFSYPFKVYEDFDPLKYIKKTLLILTSEEISTPYLIKNAKYLYKKITQNNYLTKCETAKLDTMVNKFIHKNHKLWDKNLLFDGLPMSLDIKFIKKHADFYNNLFAKHGIDYKV